MTLHSMRLPQSNPGLLNKLDVDEVELILPVPSPKSNSTGVSEGVSNRVPNGVSDTAKAIYSHIQADPNISRNELVNLTGISLKNVQKHINRLKELGLIRRIGSTRLKCRLFEGLSIRLSKGLSETAANISILNHFDRDSDRDDRDEIVEDTHIAYNEE